MQEHWRIAGLVLIITAKYNYLCLLATKLNMNTKMDMTKVEMTTMTDYVEMDGR